jgi:Hpt domain
VVQKYLQCHEADATTLQAALQAGNLEHAGLIIHTLVASSATVGALALEQQARVVLAALRSAPLAPPAAMIQALVVAHTQARCALADWLQAPVQLSS